VTHAKSRYRQCAKKRKMAPNDAFRCVRSPTSIAENREKRDRHVVDSCSPGCPYFPAHTHTLPPPNTMSAFLAGSPVVAKVAAKPVAKRNVTVRAAAPSEYVPRLPSRSFILLARTLSHAAEPRNVATRRRASWLTFDAPPRPNPPRVVNNSGVTRRAAVAGVLAFFVAQPVRALPIIPSSGEKEKNADTTSKTFRRCLSLLSLTRDESPPSSLNVRVSP